MKVSEFTAVLAVLSSLLTVTNLASLPEKCEGYNYYYDHGTDHCEQCREICLHAEIMRTVEMCQTNCPRYLKAIECANKENSYYDEALDLCSSCSGLCDNHQLTGTTQTCKQKCKAYLETLTPQQVPSLHKQNSLKAVHGSDEKSDSSAASLHPGWISAIAIGCVAILCTIFVAIILYKTACSNQYVQAPQNDEGNQKGPRQPVEETSQGSRDSQHFAIDAGSPTSPVLLANAMQTGFSDLEDDGRRNETLRV